MICALNVCVDHVSYINSLQDEGTMILHNANKIATTPLQGRKHTIYPIYCP